jgi:para-nitrobenzyl esterase
MQFRCVAFSLIAATASLSPVSNAGAYDPQSASSANVVVTETGPVRGIDRATSFAFLGIPFAAPPVGELRWRAPQPPHQWSGVFDAMQFGKHCPQASSVPDPNASEACLFLNVYVPRGLEADGHNRDPRPVMVWVHGGAHIFGDGDAYDPTPMLQTGGVIVVTLNYRLGALGFLAHPALAADGSTGMYGIQDQQMALRWVKTNIAQFGGDPHNVTIFGESAGGLDVITHLVSPQSAQYFDKAIVQSGAYQLPTPSLSASESLGVAFANSVGCLDQTATCLRSTSVANVLAHGANAFNQSTVDGDVLPESQLAAIRAGHIKRVPVIQGANSHEGRFFVSPGLTESGYQLTLAAIAAATGKPFEQIRATYPLNATTSAFDAASEAFGDAAFACSAQLSSRLLAAHGTRVYTYEFDDAAASPLGAMHSAELKYLFNLNFGGPTVGPDSLPESSQLLAARMRRYWTQFARSGNTNSSDPPSWNPSFAGQVQLFKGPSPMTESATDYGDRHNCTLWD